MFESSAELHVRCTPAEAFEHVARGFLVNHSLWDPSVTSMSQTSSGPIGLGTTALEYRRFGPWRIVSEVRISAFEPDRSFGFETTNGPMVEQSRFAITPRADGSTVQLSFRLMPVSPMLRVLEPLIRPMIKSNARRNTDRMRDALDGAATGSSSTREQRPGQAGRIGLG